MRWASSEIAGGVLSWIAIDSPIHALVVTRVCEAMMISALMFHRDVWPESALVAIQRLIGLICTR